MVQDYIKIYISSENKKIYIDDNGGGVFTKQEVGNMYNSIHKLTYSNQYYVVKNDYIKDTRISRTYSVRKRRASDYVYLNGSPYHDAEGLSQLRSCLHDAIINDALRIGEKSTKTNCIDSVYLEG